MNPSFEYVYSLTWDVLLRKLGPEYVPLHSICCGRSEKAHDEKVGETLAGLCEVMEKSSKEHLESMAINFFFCPENIRPEFLNNLSQKVFADKTGNVKINWGRVIAFYALIRTVGEMKIRRRAALFKKESCPGHLFRYLSALVFQASLSLHRRLTPWLLGRERDWLEVLSYRKRKTLKKTLILGGTLILCFSLYILFPVCGSIV